MRGNGARAIARTVAILGLFLIAVGAVACRAAEPSAVGSQVTPSVPVVSAVPSATITEAQAIAAAEAFLGRKLANPKVDAPTADRPWYSVVEDGSGASLSVDPATGRIISMLALGEFAPGVNITQEQAVAAAQQFLTDHRVPFGGMTMTVKLIDHGAAQEFDVTWQRYVDGAAVPDSRSVSVDARTGQVISFNDFRRAYGAVASPSIGREDAIRLATQKSGLTDPKIEKVELTVVPVGDWAGRTVWSVQLSAEVPIPGQSVGYISAFWIYVDATTGESLIFGQG